MKNVEVDGVTYNGVSSVSLRTTSGSYANFIDEDETTQTVVNSVSGKIIHVDDAVTNGVQDLELFDSGGTEITAATTVCIANKNLFRIDLLSASTVSKGITFTKNADGSITANGTSTGTYASASVTLDPAIFQAGQVFTISCGKSTGDLYVQLILNYTDGTTDYMVSRTGPTVFMVPKAVSTVTASVQITASGVTLTNQTIYPQIELAGTPSAFVMNTYSQISYNGSTMPTLPASVANLWTFSSTVASMTMTYTVDVSANADHLQSQNDTTTAVMLTKITRPEGGTIGQVLTKIGDDEETWDDVHGLPDGGTNGQVLTHTEDGAAWRTPTINEITDNSVLPVPSNVLYDAFRDIETDKISKPAGGTTGQVLKKTASGSEWGDAVDSTARASITALQAAVGSPLVASTAAAMVDTTKVYVYTGSETGYTAGNWYYYDGSAWVSGGVYNSVAVQTDATLTAAGVAADAKATGDEINDLKSAIENLEAIPHSVKMAMDTLFSKAAYADVDAASSYATFHAWATANPVASISAVFTQGSATINANANLDMLKQYLVVTATYSDSTTATVTDYTLSGTLIEGTSAITVSYGGKTDTFNVTVSGGLDSIAYGNLTYRDIFITNNKVLIGDFEGTYVMDGDFHSIPDTNYQYKMVYSGSPEISDDYSVSPTHSLKCFGTSAVRAFYKEQNAPSYASGTHFLVAANIKCTRYVTGNVGAIFNSPINNAVDRASAIQNEVSNGFVPKAVIAVLTAARTEWDCYIGVNGSGNADCYIDDVVISVVPTEMTAEQAQTLYENYTAMVLGGAV